MESDPATFASMTVNERLFVAGLMSRWDDAVAARDRRAAIATLDQVGLADQSAWIVDTVFANPTKYGFADRP